MDTTQTKREPRAVREFIAKIVFVLPQITRSDTERVRGQEKWGFLLKVIETGEQLAIWGHWIRPFSEANISGLKRGDKLLITYRNSHDWSWEKVNMKRSEKRAKVMKKKKRN